MHDQLMTVIARPTCSLVLVMAVDSCVYVEHSTQKLLLRWH